MSTVSSLHHIVFCVKHRRPALPVEYREELYRYIWGVIRNNNCQLLRIGGIENHIHLLVDVHQDVPLSVLVRDIKRSSSFWLKEQGDKFASFQGWAEGYYASSVSHSHSSNVIKYISEQVAHHSRLSMSDELRIFAESIGREYTDPD